MRSIAILRKELIDSLRDRKAIATGMMFGLMGPVVIFYIVSIMAVSLRADTDVSVALCHPANAPMLVEHLAGAGIRIARDAKACLDIPDRFEERIAQGEPVRVGILADLAHTDPAVTAVEREIHTFANTLGAERLIARGVAPTVTSPVTVDMQSTNPVSRLAQTFGAMVVIFFVVTPFMVGAGLAADLTAGERERRTLESLMATPARAFEIVFGKFLAVSAFNIAGTSLCIALGTFILAYSALPELGVGLNTGAVTILHVIAWLLPLSFFVSAIELAVGFWSKSFKDAQNVLMMLIFVPIAIGYASLNHKGATSPWPILWEVSAIGQPLFGSTTPVAPFIVVVAIELALTAMLLLVTTRRLKNARLLAQT